MSYEWSQIIPLILILIMGIPHGAADGVLAFKVYRLRSPRDQMLFLGSYLLLSLATLALWIYLPMLSLLGFLCISAFHFGLGDVSINLPHLSDRPVQQGLIAWCHGGSLIFLLPTFHQEEVLPIFQVITNQDSEVVKAMIYCGLIYWLIGFIVILTQMVRSNLGSNRDLYIKMTLEILGLTIMYAVLPPLWSFAVYFCCIHSLRHFKRLIITLNNYGITIKDWINFTVTNAITIGSILFVSVYCIGGHYSDTLLRSVFIGLSILTVPHVVLIDLLRPLDLVSSLHHEHS